MNSKRYNCSYKKFSFLDTLCHGRLQDLWSSYKKPGGLTENFREVQFQKKWSQIWLLLQTDRQLKSDISNGVSLKRHSNY
ncbi:hypothetical protein P5673_021677 [Acropora cervicornis]|uniref:Uncharacterized protein n=1 Tax=Acropora cervicornis TaxID=6130 RepID=A0AAD9Q880_ACRCE|nr:hypothetical protein P5673_021677 [Acropora cervicornis]